MRFFVRTMIIAGIAAGVLGCQSGPHWPHKFAWWKNDTPPADSSAIARSVAPLAPPATVAKTAPALPSTQSKPEAIAAAGMEGATPPSAANLAATKPTVAAPVAATTTPPSPQALAATAPPSSAVPAAGPYDPNAYRPTGTVAASSGISNSDLSPVSDRYGMTASAPPASPVSSPVGAPPATPVAAPPAGDRYAMQPDRYSTPTAVPPTTSAVAPPAAATTVPETAVVGSPAPASLGSPSAARATVSDRYGNPTPDSYAPTGGIAQTQPAPTTVPATATPPAATSAASVASGPMANSPTIQLASAPGQYRPGGTSNYLTSPATSGQQIEVATLPSSPAPPAAAQPAATVPQTSGSRY